MEKMLKGNNSLTALNTILLCACFYMLFQINGVQTRQTDSIHNIQSALYWKLNIKTDAPNLPSDNNNNNDSGNAYQHRDVLLANNEKNHAVNKQTKQ